MKILAQTTLGGYPPKMRNSLGRGWRGIVWLAGYASVSARLWAAGKIPDLRPPKTLLEPDFWELHGREVILGSLAGVALVAWLVLRWRRTETVQGPTPAEELKQRLDHCRQQAENPAQLVMITRLLKQWLQATAGLPPGEFTTDEFLRQAPPQLSLEPGLVEALRRFLTDCDQRKFSPAAPVESQPAAESAWQLLRQIETALAPPAPPGPPAESASLPKPKLPDA